jgi:N-acetyl-gamma-glutamyl-phosphate reductase
VPSVAVLGASGYAGAIAAMLVYRHPHFELMHATARSEAGQRLDDVHPRTRVPLELEPWDPDAQGDVDAALVCWPHRVAAPAVAALRERGVRVVDLSADFRLRDRGIYEDWYGPHGAPELFGRAVYGLPELHREDIAGADLVANPGCYPTAALLALAPLVDAGLITPASDVIVDAKSGVSGAGKTPTERTHFSEVHGSLSAYGVFNHRHGAEIEQGLGREVTFTPHLVPLDRGILSTIYVRVPAGTTESALGDVLTQAYAGETFVRLTGSALPQIKHVVHTNFCDIGWRVEAARGSTARAILVSVIDNLVKGAAGQAVQNMNVMLGLNESLGLL